jgi:hypothetical protein
MGWTEYAPQPYIADKLLGLHVGVGPIPKAAPCLGIVFLARLPFLASMGMNTSQRPDIPGLGDTQGGLHILRREVEGGLGKDYGSE